MKHLFLDLEDTVIDSWWNPVLVNVEKIKRMIGEVSPQKIHIFSGAIWNEDDKQRFSANVQADIEKSLGIKIDSVISMADAINVSSWKTFSFSCISEALILVGKFKLFEDYCELNMGGHECVLLDDQCPSKTIFYNGNNTFSTFTEGGMKQCRDDRVKIEMINITRDDIVSNDGMRSA